MKKHLLIAVALVVFTLALATVAMAADPYVGTWKLNVAKSKINIGPVNIKRSTLTITAQDNGIKVVDELVAADGKAHHIEDAAKYDGKDYPVIGAPDFCDAKALRKIDDNTFEVVFKKAGKEVSKGQESFSRDGKTLTFTEKGKNAKGPINNTLVYEKQ